MKTLLGSLPILAGLTCITMGIRPARMVVLGCARNFWRIFKMPWRKNVDPIIKDYLDLQVKETVKFRDAYSQAKNKADAQLWIAVANMTKHLFNLELKIKYLEGAIRDLNERLLKTTEKKPEDVLKELEKEAKENKISKKTVKKKTKKVKGSLRKTLKKF